MLFKKKQVGSRQRQVAFFVNTNSIGQFPADTYWNTVAKIKTEEPQGCPAYASWGEGACSIYNMERVSGMCGAPYVMQ